MKNFLSKLWSLSRTDRVRTLAIDAVSLPSFCRVNMLKLVSVFALLLTIGVGNVLGADATMTAGTNGSTASVSVGGKSHSAIKVGTSSKGGTMTITIPTGANKLSLYAAAWNGVSNLSLNITPNTNVSPTSIALTANSGIANNSPFTFNGSADSYLFNIDLSSITSQTTLTFTSSTTKRFVVWGAKVCYNPTSPTNGTITATTAHLSWTDSKNVNNYEVYYSTSSTAPTASSSGTATTNKYINLTSLSAGTKYYWWVRAYDSYCKTNWVAGNSFTTTAGASCSANPSIGDASLNGSISLSSFPVQTTGWTVGANCAWTDFGFVWSSTVSTPTLAANGTASSGCTKIQKATSGTSTSTTHSITGSFETGTTYYVRGYGKNGYASGTYQYTDVLTITPRSVEFNSNGGSAVDTKYVNSGTKVTAPSDPTKTGYNFGEWQLNSSEFDFANTNVTSNITLVATWTAKTTTVSFNQNSGTGGQTGTLTATYGSAMPSAPVTCPTRTGYDFGGYYDGSGGTGTKYYNADGSSATNWDKENSTWTLYAKWTVKSYSVTWKVNNTNYSAGGSTSVNHGSRVATLPTAPDPGDYCGEKFVGWTDADGGVYTHGTSNLYTKAADFPNATGNQIFYAVFADYDE